MVDDSHKRAHRVAHSLQHALSSLLIEGLRDPRIGLVTITEVRMGDDLRSARVFVSAYGDAPSRERSLLGLKAAASFLRRRVSEALNLRFAPMLHFQYDDTLLRAARLDSLLHRAAQGADAEAADAALDAGTPPVFVERERKVTLAGPVAPPRPPGANKGPAKRQRTRRLAGAPRRGSRPR